MYNQKHLSLSERNIIEQGLNENLSLKDISLKINKDPTTISKEIKKHRLKKEANTFNDNNKCDKKTFCDKKNICNIGCLKKCSNCSLCNAKCPDFSPIICKRLIRFPYTCNGCPRKSPCRLEKFYYRSLASFNSYKTNLSESRQGISLSEEELSNLDNIVSPLIKQGQSISHIHSTQELPCTRATLYNYIEKNYLSVGNLDLPRKVRFRKRKKHNSKPKDSTIRKGRTYEDFLNYISDNPDTSIVEMDTVEGIKGGKVLLTLLFRNSRLMLAFLLNNKTQDDVLKVFNLIENLLGNELFEKTFPVILTDNGTEFSNPLSLEFNNQGIGRTRIFYCNPGASYQKGMLEKNHEFIRYVIPKGTSMDNLSQTDITKMINHINSLARESLNWTTPFNLAKLLLGKNVLKKLNLTMVPANEIQLTKQLLKKN